jgi:hypothetical protein
MASCFGANVFPYNFSRKSSFFLELPNQTSQQIRQPGAVEVGAIGKNGEAPIGF